MECYSECASEWGTSHPLVAELQYEHNSSAAVSESMPLLTDAPGDTFAKASINDVFPSYVLFCTKIQHEKHSNAAASDSSAAVRCCAGEVHFDAE